jgi:hypothetical protein
MKQKVFCIGLAKTGSSSLAKALEYMGFHLGRRQVIFKQHYPELDLLKAIEEKQYEKILAVLPKYDAFVDNPWPSLYQVVAKAEPSAKFILTTREEKTWIVSALSYFGDSQSKFRVLNYGKANPIGNEAEYLERYRKHNQEVIEYFKEETDRLLVLPLEANDKWEQLSTFLGRKKPKLDYPVVNQTSKSGKANSKGLRKWLSIPYVLYLEVLFTLVYARIMTLFYPFKKVARKMANSLKTRSESQNSEEALGRAIKLSQITKSLSKKVPFRALCFEQALCMQLLLQRRGFYSEIHFGLKTKEDQLAAHAWLVFEDITLSGAKGKEQFAVIKSFSNY